MSEQSAVIAVGECRKKTQHLSACGGRILECYVISFISRGHGFYEDHELGRVDLKAPTVICQFPGRWHCFDPDPKGTWDEFWVMFDPNAAFSEVLPKDALIACQENAQVLHDTFRQLQTAWFFDNPIERERISFYLHRILYEIHVAQHGRSMPDAMHPVEMLRQMMAQQLDLPHIEVEAFSKSVDISYESLRKQFQKTIGVSPKQYFLHMKISRAKELLLLPDAHIRQVAQCLGFEDPYYFSRLFKGRTGLSPRAWRTVHLREAPRNSIGEHDD